MAIIRDLSDLGVLLEKKSDSPQNHPVPDPKKQFTNEQSKNSATRKNTPHLRPKSTVKFPPNNRPIKKTEKPSQHPSPNSSPKQRKFRLSPEIIDKYQNMDIFKKINPKGLREPDIIILHNLARQLLKTNPGLSSENILKNQISLYEFMRQELKRYNKTKRTDEDKNNMRKAIRKKLATLTKKPVVDQLYESKFDNEANSENTKETHIDTIITILKSAQNDSPYETMPEFLDSAEQLNTILEHEKKKSKNKDKNRTSTPTPSAVPTSTDTPKKSQNLCVIDIGTNAVKCNLFVDGKFEVLHNQTIGKNENGDLNQDDIINLVIDFFNQANGRKINPNRIFIVATESLRTSGNADQIKKEILEKTGRKVHIISPEREAFFSIYGGLKYIPKSENQPGYVLFVESGGGSTEISLVDTQKRGLSVLNTISLPLGSRHPLVDDDEDKTDKLVTEKIEQLFESLKKKKIDASSLGLVINAGTAARIMWKKNRQDGERYNPKYVTLNRYGMSVADFNSEIKTLLNELNSDVEKVKNDFELTDAHLNGFKGHARVLNAIMSEIEQQFPDDIKNCQVLTTNGGLKEGLMQQLLHLDKQNIPVEKIEQELFVTDKPEKLPSVSPENDDYKKIWHEFAAKIKTTLNGELEEDTEAAFFTAKITTKNKDDQEITTLITATSEYNVSLSAKKSDGTSDVPDQKIFDELAIKAQKTGINFGNIQTPEFKARLMIACFKHNVTMTGQPELNDDFLNLLDADGDSAKYLKAYKHKLDTQQQNQPAPSQAPAPTQAQIPTPASAPAPQSNHGNRIHIPQGNSLS